MIMAVEFEVGSLANLISGNKFPSKTKKKDSLEAFPSEKGIVKFKTLNNLKKKTKWEVEEVEKKSFKNTPFSVETNHNKKERRKLKYIKKHNENENETENKQSNASCAQKRLKNKKKKEMETSNPERKEREVFVGNVPNDITKRKLKTLFQQYGKVESVRLRCAPLSDPRIPKKVAIIKKKFHPDRNSMHAFVRFIKAETAKKAVEANGIVFENHHLRVDLVSTESQHDLKKALFLGNVPFAAEEEDLWKIFESCGTISSIRIIRDKFTGVGKGFAYINFENSDAVELALKLDGTELNKRQLRVKRCIKKPPKSKSKGKKSKKGKKQRVSDPEKKSKKRKHEDSNEEINSGVAEINETTIFEEEQNNDLNKESKKIKRLKANKKLNDENDSETHIVNNLDSGISKKSFKASFQGQKTAEDKKLKKKKKEKINKGELKKMSMIRKISSKSKPSMKKSMKPILKIKSASKKMKFKP